MSAEALARLKSYWETITRERVAAVDSVYATEAYFRDPFNEVRGLAELERIFDHMFDTLHEPRFTIPESIVEGERAVLIWDFDFRVKAWKPGRHADHPRALARALRRRRARDVPPRLLGCGGRALREAAADRAADALLARKMA